MLRGIEHQALISRLLPTLSALSSSDVRHQYINIAVRMSKIQRLGRLERSLTKELNRFKPAQISSSLTELNDNLTW